MRVYVVLGRTIEGLDAETVARDVCGDPGLFEPIRRVEQLKRN
jgi:hypothetical protein